MGGEILAFDNIDGVKVFSHQTKQVYVIGDYFCVYEDGNSVPLIYDWQAVTAVSENTNEFSITTNDGEHYKISKLLLPDVMKQLTVRAILEGNIARYPNISYSHQKRILPSKNYYTRCDMPEQAFIAKGVYNEKEISYSNVTLLNTRLGKLFFGVGGLIAILAFACCALFIGELDVNWKYFIPISAFSGVIVAMFIYIACAIVAKYIYTSLAKVDVALDQEITFMVCSEGFAAIESALFSGSEVIRWDEVAYFIETNYVFIIFKNKRAVFWLPKRLFSKEQQRTLSNFIAARLHMK